MGTNLVGNEGDVPTSQPTPILRELLKRSHPLLLPPGSPDQGYSQPSQPSQELPPTALRPSAGGPNFFGAFSAADPGNTRLGMAVAESTRQETTGERVPDLPTNPTC